ncbi:hypothetical protein VP1G_04774 [Cytospora mali]|uniref:Uncharacterized protein n=1 Tax=Cytospora mali TaxID=578113 RepID=A0A194V0Q3_CYTMA|nr:hypothetical protein VP1G_04774 [Valsa mali var. pyri (nom. inval.)]
MADIDDYPPGFPVPAEDYIPPTPDDVGMDLSKPVYTDEDDDRDDKRTRELTSLYPYDFLDPTAPKPNPQNMQQPLGLLRKEMVDKMQQNGQDGDWTLVEFVPAWTDPDWDDRFVFTGPTKSNDPQVQMYMKPGLLQKQRPALLPGDMARGPTEAAKRFGIDPIHQDDPFYGHSGVTPTTANFEVPLGYARVTPSNQGEKHSVNVDDLNALVAQFEANASARGQDTTEENLRAHLEDAARGYPTELVQVDSEIAAALLALMEQVFQREEQEEYQRLLFAGNTSNELVQNNIWTLGMNAVTDLSTPLHELLTEDKWEITDTRSELDPRTGDRIRARTVYNISGQQGEYCMSNDLIRAALQPTLQLVSKFLYSDHPITWAWADIYKLRPVRGQDEPSPAEKRRHITNDHIESGVTEQEHFAVWLGDYDAIHWYPEIEDLYLAGFDSVKYTCEILKRTIQWEINAKYQGDDNERTGLSEHLGFTQIIPQPNNYNMPFVIRISISADYIWPLLVKEYSEAEKAACSFTLAATMLHELTHAICMARQQLFHPSCSWLCLNPQWMGDLTQADLDNLITFGYRFIEARELLGSHVYQTDEQDYLEGEPINEEGFSAENQYFGGLATPMAAGTNTRFLDDLVIMGCLNLWPQYPAAKLLPNTYQAIPRDMILKFFSEKFWTHDLVKWGHQAMKIWPKEAPRMSTNWGDFKWWYVEKKFGRPVKRWMKVVRIRMQYDDDHEILWKWLMYLTMTAVEPIMLMNRWLQHRRSWKSTDKALWIARNDCSDRAATAQEYLQKLLDEANAFGEDSRLPATRAEPFRECLNGMQDMHRYLTVQATFYQVLTVEFHKISDQTVKDAIQRLFGEHVHTRLSAIHMAIADEMIKFLDGWASIDQRVLNRMAAVPQLVELVTTGRNSLRENLVAIRQLFVPVLRTFGPDRVGYVFNRDDFLGVASGSALDLAKRVERMAKRQLLKMSGPQRTVAESWLALLNDADSFRDAVPGSVEDETNQNLDWIADFIDGVTTTQEQVVANQHPVQTQPQPVQEPVLQTNQPLPDETMRERRFITSPCGQPPSAWQTVYAESSGYIPYEDPKTGFTRFQKVNIPDESTAQPELSARALIQGRALAGSLTASGIAAPSFPGVNMPNIGGQLSNKQVAALEGLVGLVRMRAETDPFAPAGQPTAQAGAPAPGVQPAAQMTRYNQAIRDLGNLIQARAEQVHANPELAGRVVPAAFGQGLQQIAGPSGENLTNTDVLAASNLFGGSMLRKNWAMQQLESIIRERAGGAELVAQLRAQQTGQGNQQSAGVGAQPHGASQQMPHGPPHHRHHL